jgi:hypothetical protein
MPPHTNGQILHTVYSTHRQAGALPPRLLLPPSSQLAPAVCHPEDRKGGQSLLRMRADIDRMVTQLRVLRRTRQNGPPGGNADVAPDSAMDAVRGDDLHSTTKENSVRLKRHTMGRNTEKRKGGLFFLQKVHADLKSIYTCAARKPHTEK